MRLCAYALFGLIVLFIAGSFENKRAPDPYGPANAAEKAMNTAAIEACAAKPGTDEALHLRVIYMHRAAIYNTTVRDLLAAGYYFPGYFGGAAELESVCADNAAALARARQAMMTGSL